MKKKSPLVELNLEKFAGGRRKGRRGGSPELFDLSGGKEGTNREKRGEPSAEVAPSRFQSHKRKERGRGKNGGNCFLDPPQIFFKKRKKGKSGRKKKRDRFPPEKERKEESSFT